MKITIVGLGEVGRCYAQALASRTTVELLFCEQRIAPAAQRLADELGVQIHPGIGDWLVESDCVLSCVVGTQSLEVTRECLAHLKPGTLFADLTTAAPERKRLAGAEAAQQRVDYVDVAIMGAIAYLREKTPLLCSGAKADAFVELLLSAGATARALPASQAGDAITLKILRSVFTKGMEALAVDVLLAAERQQLRPALYEVLKDIDQAPLPAFLEMLVSTHVVHATRRLHEVEEAERQLASLGIASSVLGGVRQRFSHSSEGLEQEPITEEQPSLAQALDWLGRHTPAA
ncbi:MULTISPECIES: NAD(P)-dependent oxidoreductase [Pseudomonas]|uniref:6-phosphogluconate dehydrogenase n=1 Tax=Pseudomonas fluorescens LMG 5329 TaxID=1324332 RepID=A0A0A1Z2R4_PSEFL|nr:MULTISPECIES: NAD(P)-dependent oxidoreductase [Pseudomonas]KGE68595.1 6-phosphogluconate dehydrogenase [Pseudomonas fluorescens LMG 5329]NWE04276.1 NAD(P)-dependent oxidoreductase [Pseudomonas sp. IPO3749]NWF23063.1 NAD(P)-dependent oxidoreductase [Pseudomonas sp. IPO3749]